MKRDRRIFQPDRRGLTRIDVVGLLCIAAVLFAVIGPALQRPRIRARQLECINNLRQVGLAAVSFSSSAGGNLPPLNESLDITNVAGQQGTISMSWPILLLPALDSTAMLKNIKRHAVVESGDAPQVALILAESERVWLPVFTCPDDPNSFRQAGGLSYVVNAGFMSRSLYHGDPDGLHRLGLLSWDGNNVSDEDEDIRISAATGVFWRKSKSFQPSFDYVSTADGTSTTLMLTENLQAGLWYDTDTARIGFGLPIDANDVQVSFGPGTFFESPARPLNTVFTGGTIAKATPQDWRINSDRTATKGTRPRPSSTHKGGINAIFCDGAGRFLSETIDPHVYAKLLTPNGAGHGEGELPSKY